MKKLLVVFCGLLLIIYACTRDGDDTINNGPDIITIDSLKINNNVLVIGIDGLRSDVMQEEFSPFMYNLSQSKNVYFNDTHIVEEYTWSGPNWSSILTGVHFDKHNVTDNSFDNDNYNTYPPFFHYIERADSSINTVSLVNWTPINQHTLLNYTDFAPLEPMNDLEVFENVENILLNKNPMDGDVIFLQFDELDGAGHSDGFSASSEEYTNTLTVIDTYVENLFNIIEGKRSEGEDWLYIIVSDHGGEGTSHSDTQHPDVNQTIFFTQHPSLQLQANCCYVSSQVDIAPTVLGFLGISSSNFNFNKDGFSIIVE